MCARRASDPEYDAIRTEALRFMKENDGVEADVGKYPSPRVSSEIPDCSMPLTFDQYSYCSLGCLYCFAYFFKTNNPAKIGKPAELASVDPEKLLATIRGEFPNDQWYKHFYSRRFLLHWGGMADPFCSFERTNEVGYKLLEGLGELRYPTLLSFKGPMVDDPKYVELFERFAPNHSFAFQASIIVNDDELARKIEIGVPSTTARLASLKRLSQMGYWTILRLRPFIIGLSDQGLEELLERALDAGISAISFECFAVDSRCNVGMKQRFDWLAKLMGVNDLQSYFQALSPRERGGYLRLNRQVKEPAMKTIYRFCAEHGLVCGVSDPDYKELNTSGSCCGMPDDYPPNQEMARNWTRSQLTFWLKEARRQFHREGVLAELHFDDVYSTAETYLTTTAFNNQHIGMVGRVTSERSAMTQRHTLVEKWNDLRSPSNPRNYLHGKVLPVGVDKAGNLVFRYRVHPYELEWREEGIDMTR